jgi:hypothetical protein
MNQHPIAFFIFNRPEITRLTFERIREVQPKMLFIVADGPRQEIESDCRDCTKTRELVSKIDWDCKVFRDYSDTNLGCKIRMSSGLDWVFEQVDTAIILEDDCLATPDFFRFCNELLDRYKDDERVFSISGSSLNPEFQPVSQSSYYYSIYPLVWGWATWRRAWKYYDVTMSLWKSDRHIINLKGLEKDWQILDYWEYVFNKTAQNEIDTWDYQWTFCSFLQNALHIIPSQNLISNIGFGQGATHTTQESHLSNLATYTIHFPLKHPLTMMRNYEADRLTEINVYQCRMRQRILKKILDYLSKLKR